MGDYNSDEHSELTYDLRQTYAQILDEVLKRIADARIKNLFVEWYKGLEDLYIEIHQKLSEKEIKEYRGYEDEKEKVKGKLVECIEVLNEQPSAYMGKDGEKDHIYMVHNALAELEMWLKKKMEEHKMFGAKRDLEGL